MFRSKKDVDAHVRDVFSKCTSENEIHLELGEEELALESYKVSYTEGNARDSLNRVCDLLTRGIGKQETPDSKKKWFDMQKSSHNNSLLTTQSSSSMSSPVSKPQAQANGGPPKSGFGHSFLNGSVSALVPQSPKTNVGSVDLQLRYLERRFDDGIGKILEQNNQFMDQMLKLKDEMKDLSNKVDELKINHQQVENVVSTITTQQTELTVAIKTIQTHQTDLLQAIKTIQTQPREEVDGIRNGRNSINVRQVEETRESVAVKPTYQLPIEKVTPELVKQSPQMPLSHVWKKPEGNWDCCACYLSNSKDTTICVACNTSRPGYETPVKIEPVVIPPTKSSFSFGFPQANATTVTPFQAFGIINTLPVTNTVDTTAKKSEENKDSPFTTLNLAGKFSFADLAKNNTPSFGGDGNSFSGAGTPLFAPALNMSTANKSSDEKTGNDTTNNANTSANANEGEDDFVPTAEFQPVIPLPPLVEVKKGDENENTIAEYRAKIYRFVNEAKEWKERGVGNIKLLQSKADASKCRVVMWREKIGKLACNFSLFPDIKVTYYQGNQKVLCFKCQDFAEEPQWEMFTVRFSSEENCKNFKDEMERLSKLTGAPNINSPSKSDDATKTSPIVDLSMSNTSSSNQSNDKPLSELFKKPDGNWDCGACYVSNGKDTTVCVACSTVRPGYEAPAKTDVVQNVSTTTPFSFGFPATNSVTAFQGFGLSNTLLTNNTSEENKDSPFTNLNLAGKFSFADLAKNNNPSFSFGGDGNTFSGTGAQLFAPALNTSTANNISDEKTGNDTANTSANANEGEDEFVPTAEFQPVIPLPPLVEVKKGDENENTIAEYRAKVYRFVNETKEWKERGVGNIKLLQSKMDPSKCRVVMWRDKIGKLACNFSLFPDIKITNYQGNPKVVCFRCQDFAEEPQWETFTCRFGSEENCTDFKNKLLQYAASPPASATSSAAPASDGSACPGCIGCDPDSFNYKNVESRQLNENLIDLPLNPDSAPDLPVPVTLNLFDTKSTTPNSAGSLDLGVVIADRSIETSNQSPLASFSFSLPKEDSTKPSPDVATVSDTRTDRNFEANNTSPLASFSFSLPNPDSAKSTPISFQMKTPTFSFKPNEGPSSIFGGSVFNSPMGTGLASSATSSPFVSPFGQPLPSLNTSATPITFSWPSSVAPDSANVTSPATKTEESNGNSERREEDEYEDVDDEEDNCMFEEDAHILIKENADSADGFVDKGEGIIRVMYDGETYCARLVITVDGENIAEHLVAVETVLEASGDRTYEWVAICSFDSPVKSRIKATFVDEEAFQSFQTVMADSLEYAEQVGVTEAILLEDPTGY